MEQDKMQALIDVLTLMASIPLDCTDDASPDDLSMYYDALAEIYNNDFRHLYSIISQFLESQSADVFPSLENWLMALRDYGISMHKEKDEVNRGIDKLYDHISLEVLRLDRMRAVRHMATETEHLYNDTLLSAETAKEQVKAAADNVAHMHEQSIAILSIFSAVVLAFMGGLSFSGSVLENLGSVSMFRLIITIILLGFILFNTLFILLRFVLYVIRERSLSQGFKSGITFFNIVLLLLLISTILLYSCGAGHIIESWGQL